MDEKEKPENRFEGEMTRMMKVAINGIEDLKKELKNTNQKVDIFLGQFNDVAVMAISDNKRITKLEGDIAELQGNIH